MKHKYYDVIVAWAEGKEVQYRILNVTATDNSWVDIPYPNFNFNGVEWRIKPEKKTVKYRLALLEKGYIAIQRENEISLTTHPFFVKWLGDWVEVEI